MDFIIGILLVIVVLLLLFNFATISISDSPGGNCNNQNYLFSSNRNNILTDNITNPKPVKSQPNNVINGKINLDNQTYYYNKYFYM